MQADNESFSLAARSRGKVKYFRVSWALAEPGRRGGGYPEGSSLACVGRGQNMHSQVSFVGLHCSGG